MMEICVSFGPVTRRNQIDKLEEGGITAVVKTSPEPECRRSQGRVPFQPKMAILLAITLGLGGGYLDLVMMVFRKLYWSDLRSFGSGRDFVWSIPVVHVVLLLIPAMLLAAISRIKARLVSLRAGSWLLATIAIWSALLRAPLYGASTLLLAAGVTRLMNGPMVASVVDQPRRWMQGLFGLLGILIVMASCSTGWHALQEHRALVGLPAAPAGALNVVLVVWDTVRASSLSLHDYPRDTTPNLRRWARKGIRFNLPLAPAPWTYPSHSCFFTGEWPYKLNSQWKHSLDAPVPTLAGYLASRGYQSAGFAANTHNASRESGLDRGFTHYDDYPLTPLSLLGRTVPGAWILANIINRGDFYAEKWIRLQSRDARGINNDFLGWLRRRRQDRPFFAFLNYFDAHDPYVPAPDFVGRFGKAPKTPRDYRLLMDYAQNRSKLTLSDVVMARDSYDDCIASLDDQLGRLLDELQAQGLLDRTVVIITSDHGEGFGYHGVFGHGGSLYLDEIAVPLVILSPTVPAERVVADPVSLRDLPATVTDLLGLADGSPFPGQSLAHSWRSATELSMAALLRSTPGRSPSPISPAFSELAQETAFKPQSGTCRRGVQMSLVASGRHYVRDGMGTELLFDLLRDPFETNNLMKSAEGDQIAGPFRKMLLKLLTDNPGSIEIENAYLNVYRQRLKTVVDESPAAKRAALSAVEKATNNQRE
jgi:arylsulfatase A-like enzyme